MSMLRVNNRVHIITISTFYVVYMLWLYPTVLDFYYINLIPYVDIVSNHRLDILGTGTDGIKILIAILLETTGLSYFAIISAPLLLIPIYLLLISIFRTLINNIYSVFLTISFLLPFASPGLFVPGCHEIGFILYLSLILALICNYKQNSNRLSFLIIVIFVVISINYISYKIDTIVIIFLLCFCIFMALKSTKDRKKILSQQILLPLIGLVVAFGLNNIFYSQFLPYLEQATTGDLGIYKISNINPDPNGIQEILFRSSIYLQCIGSLRLALVGIGLGTMLSVIIWKFWRERDLANLDIIFLSSLFSGGMILLIYTILGLFDYFYLVFCGFLGICLLRNYIKNSFKWSNVINIIIWTLLLLGILYMGIAINSGYYIGHKGPDEFQYLTAPTLWLGNHIEENYNAYIKSDVLTIGFISYYSSKQKILINYPKSYFSIGDVTKILTPNNQKETTQNRYFVLNNNLHYISTDRWYYIKSLSNFEYNIRNAHSFNKAYSMGLVDIVL